MLILIHGEDTYSSKQYLEKLVHGFNAKHAASGGAVEVFDAEEGTWEELGARLTAAGLFSSKKLVIAKGLLENKEVRDSLTDFLDTHEIGAGTSLIVYHAGAPDKRLKLVARLAKEQYSKECPLPSERDMPAVIQRVARELGASIEPAAARLLVGMIGTDTWRAANELAKLSAGKGTITARAVGAMVHASTQENIWKFVDALSSGDRKTALGLVDAQLEAVEAPQQFLGMIIRQTRLLLALHGAEGSDASLASELKLNPFVVQKTRAQSRRFTVKRLIGMYHALARLDRSLKESRGEPKLLFTVLVDSIVR
ncbi:MAG: DNA polymerase III subunit delta [Parcubacteria group bacterium]|nr:DNA polymerase III subunit delta [Parcubacteria group bacterium]